jgi:hypothetical protein
VRDRYEGISFQISVKNGSLLLLFEERDGISTPCSRELNKDIGWILKM